MHARNVHHSYARIIRSFWKTMSLKFRKFHQRSGFVYSNRVAVRVIVHFVATKKSVSQTIEMAPYDAFVKMVIQGNLVVS